MKTWEMFLLIKPIIDAGLSNAGIDAVFMQSYQPTQQGVTAFDKPQVYAQIISARRYGFVERSEIWNETNQNFDHVELQQMETTFQMGVLMVQNPKKTRQDTSLDILNTVAAIMQSSSTISTLEASGVGIYRVTDLRNPYFMNDADRFEASPSFDFTLTHKQVTIVSNPKISATDYAVYPI